MMPLPEFAGQVAVRVGGGETSEQQRLEMEENPFSYLHVVKPGIHFGDQPEHREQHFNFARSYFGQMLEQKVLQQDKEPGIYIYRQEFHDGHEFEGLILGVSVIDYLEGSIRKHENTITEKEARMAEHVTKTGVVGEPVLLSNPDESYTKDWIRRHKSGEPILNFDDDLGITHMVWGVYDKTAIAEIQQSFRNTNALYIADGHHRIAASSLYLTHMHNEMNWEPNQMCFMAYILGESTLWINSFHRIVKGLGDAAVDKIISEAEHRFLVTKESKAVVPHETGEFGVYTRKGWFRLEFRHDGQYHTPAENLDVTRMEKYIFAEILDIQDSKADARLSFMRGDMPPKELEVLVNSGAADIAFVLFPNSMQEIKAVADAKQTMPPKSTWIEPKLLTGMMIQKF